uniref:Uncharacterized protein n=1 Tax=Candidatus Berkiella cookevillensis TaxID=437022 RepID=A0A0Q9YI07_9GAMM
MLGPSSLNWKDRPISATALAVSPSPSSIVAVKVTKFAALKIEGSEDSSGSFGLSCATARLWSNVTKPLSASTLILKTSSLPTAVRPTTTPLSKYNSTSSVLKVSVNPLLTPEPLIPKAKRIASKSSALSSLLSLKPSAPKALSNKLAKEALAFTPKSLSSTIRVGTATALRLIFGPSSLNWKDKPISATALAVSPSPSSIVAVKVTKFAALKIEGSEDSSGSFGLSCATARLWSNVTKPLSASTLILKTSSLPTAVLPTTTPLSKYNNTSSALNVSVNPLLTPELLIPNAKRIASKSSALLLSLSLKLSAPKALSNKLAKEVLAFTPKSLSSTIRVGTATALRLIFGPSSLNWKDKPISATALAVSPSPSSIVAVKVTKFAALKIEGSEDSSGSFGLSCTTARS